MFAKTEPSVSRFSRGSQKWSLRTCGSHPEGKTVKNNYRNKVTQYKEKQRRWTVCGTAQKQQFCRRSCVWRPRSRARALWKHTRFTLTQSCRQLAPNAHSLDQHDGKRRRTFLYSTRTKMLQKKKKDSEDNQQRKGILQKIIALEEMKIVKNKIFINLK